MSVDVVRKDAPAALTIACLHALLDGLGFRPDEALLTRWSAGDACHSCHVRFPGYPLLYANGKGVTPDLAYAGALAEFMERLQCLADARFTRAGNIHVLPPFSRPELRSVAEILADVPGLAAGDLHALTAAEPGPLPCYPMADVFGRRTVALPYGLLCFLTGSSGMCAGNTTEEALCHGICEVFERHAIRAVASGGVDGLPTLPLDTLPLQSPVVRRQVQEVLDAGIDVIVKDASLGGMFPVLAVVLAERRSPTCAVSFGSDPVFDVALSRCLTEAFQGASRLHRRIPVDGSPRPLDTNNCVEVLFDRLQPDVGRASAGAAFCRADSNRDALTFSVERTRRAGRRLYVRDCSVFGFPSYYVYVEGLSALRTLRPANFASLDRHADEVRATIFRLDRAAPDDVTRCGRVLFDEMTTSNPTLELGFAEQVLRAPVAAWLGLRPLLALMLVEAGEPGKARTVVEWPPMKTPEPGPDGPALPPIDEVASWWPAYVDLRARAVDRDVLRRAGEAFFGAQPPRPGHQQAASGPLPVPRCLNVYCCPSCPCRDRCRLDGWYRLAQKLRGRFVAQAHDTVLEALALPG